MTGLFQGRYDDLAPGLRSLAEKLEVQEEERAQTGTKAMRRRPSDNGGLVFELAKVILPAVLAFGGAWLSMHDQITELRGDVKTLSQQVSDIKAMLGIGVFQGKR